MHQMKNNLSFSSGISDTELENSLEAEHRKNLEEARIKGKHFAKQNRPELKGDSLEYYVSELLAKYGEMKARVHQKLQPDSCHTEAKMLSDDAERKINELEQKRQSVQTQMHNFELEMNQNGESLGNMKSLKPGKNIHIILAIIGITEILFNTGALQLLGGNWLISLVMSAGITGALFFLAKHLAQYLKESSHERPRKIAVTLGATFLALGVFYLLATLRAEQLKEQAHYNVHPIFLVYVNLLFYVVTVWYYHRNTTPEKEKQEHERVGNIKKQHDDFKRQDEELEGEIKSIKDELAQKLGVLLYKPEYARRLSERISRWSMEAVEAFKSSNLAHRPDRKAPDCFLYKRTGNDNYESEIK